MFVVAVILSMSHFPFFLKRNYIQNMSVSSPMTESASEFIAPDVWNDLFDSKATFSAHDEEQSKSTSDAPCVLPHVSMRWSPLPTPDIEGAKAHVFKATIKLVPQHSVGLSTKCDKKSMAETVQYIVQTLLNMSEELSAFELTAVDLETLVLKAEGIALTTIGSVLKGHKYRIHRENGRLNV